ncbi:MAG: OmpA family protein [Clostridium sp.]|nr:OmpA family protein [Clostridium sp.]
MKKAMIILPLLAGALMCTGCAGKKKLAEMQTRYDQLSTTLQDTKVQLAKCEANSESLDARLGEAKRANAELKKAYEGLQSSLDKSLQQNSQGNVNISKLVDEINASNKFIKQLVEAKDKSDSLNMVLTNNLTRSLSREEMQEVDIQVLKGVVYISLADNMLYKSGSYEINDRAGQTLSKIAKIIMDYKDYDVLVEGNTDNVPISRTNIRNNWDLSALRASSVVQALQNTYGVDPKRLSAAGRGEYNPIADNNTEVGKQRNRRTQIIITPKLDQFMDLIDKAPEAGQ